MDFITVVLLIVFFVSIFWILIAILTKKKYKIPIVVSISSLVLVFILQGLQVDKEGKKPVTPAKTKEEMGIDISGKNEEQRIQEALNVINEFLNAIHNDNLDEAYKCITPEYYNLLSLGAFKGCIKKENFIREVSRGNFKFNNFDDYRTKGDSVWFEVPKNLVPTLYFCMDYIGEVLRKKSHEVSIWLEDKTKRYYTSYQIIVGCIRLNGSRRSEWKVEHIYPGPGASLRWEARAERILYHKKLR